MKLNLLTLIFIFSVLFSFSQSIENVDIGTLQDLPEETSYQQAIGYDSDAYYFIRSDHKTGLNRLHVWLEAVSSLTNQIESSNEIILPKVSGFQTEYETMFYKKRKFILFTSARNNNQNKIILYVSYLKPDGTMQNKPKQIASVPLSNELEDGFDIHLSKDEKNIVIESHKTIKKYNGDKFNLVVLDFDLNQVSNSDIVLNEKYNARELKILQKVYTGSKLIMFAKSEIISRRRSSTKGTEYEYVLHIYDINKKTINEFSVSMQKYKVADARFTVDKEGNIVVGGFMRGRSVRFPNEKQGMFFKKYNPKTLKVIPDLDLKSYYLKFPREFLAELTKPEYGETKELQYSYEVRSVEELDNGSYIVLAEQYWQDGRVVSSADSDDEFGISYYHYNNILVGGINKKGKFDWVKLYPKSQKTTNDYGYFSSYKLIRTANKIRLLYNDHSKNLHTGQLKKVKDFTNNIRSKPSGKAGLYTIYMDGSYERDLLFNVKDDDFVIIPQTIGKNSLEWGVGLFTGKGVKFASFTLD